MGSRCSTDANVYDFSMIFRVPERFLVPQLTIIFSMDSSTNYFPHWSSNRFVCEVPDNFPKLNLTLIVHVLSDQQSKPPKSSIYIIIED